MSDDLLIDPPSPPGRRGFMSRLGYGMSRFARPLKWLAVVLLVVVVLYYPVGMVVVQKIDDDPKFSAAPVSQGGSQAVAVAVALINREINQNGWTPNDPFFQPGWALDNMPNFQRGIIGALKRFAIELQDQIGRNRGTSSADSDLQTAVSMLNYDPNTWVWGSGAILIPQPSSEDQYQKGMRALISYNNRLASGQAIFERRADNLLSTLDRIGKDLGGATERINQQINQHAGDWIDFQADDVFYQTKGLLYADALLLRDLGQDFNGILAEKGAKNVWDRMIESMMEGATLRPWIVINGRPDALMQPNHLAAEGFYLIRARAQLEELNDILIK